MSTCATTSEDGLSNRYWSWGRSRIVNAVSRCADAQPHCSRGRVLSVLKPKFKRALVALTVLTVAAWTTLAPASYAACVAVPLKPAPSLCQTQAPVTSGSSMSMPMNCLAQLHGLDACVISQPSTIANPLFHFVALAPPPPSLFAPAFVPPPRFHKHPPPISPVPLTIRYGIFLK